MNLMILSPGRRVELVNYFKEAFHSEGGEVYTLDMSPMSPALYEGDKKFVIEKDFSNLDSYIDNVIEICKKNNVKAIISLIDPELELLSKNREKFIENNIFPIVSDYELVKTTFDKYLFSNKYKDIVEVIPTFDGYFEAKEAIDSGKVEFPLFAKIRNGSGSAGIGKIENNDELEAYKERENYIMQPFVKTKEFGIDVYFDMITGEIVSLFIKEKLNMRAGETDKSISLYRQDIVDMVMKFNKLGFKGPVDIDIFEDKSGKLYVNEINPRFGGGYAHAYNGGANFIEKIVKNLKNIENSTDIGNYEKDLVMLKYNGIMFKKENQLEKKNSCSY